MNNFGLPIRDDSPAGCLFVAPNARLSDVEYSIVPFGTDALFLGYPAFRSGLLSNVPAGLILSPRRGGATRSQPFMSTRMGGCLLRPGGPTDAPTFCRSRVKTACFDLLPD